MDRRKMLKRSVILSGTYVVLLAVLLFSITTAKFADARIAYSSFGASSFNAVILGENTVDDMNSAIVNVFGRTLETADFYPGMLMYSVDSDTSTDTSRRFPFTVANGISTGNASDATVEYKVILRTTGNLPLRYTLYYAGGDMGAGSTEPSVGSQGDKLLVSGDPVKIESEYENDITWYERHFYEKDADGEPDYSKEGLFTLQGGQLALDKFQLILEWPITAESVDANSVVTPASNHTVYMKEVDLLEVYVSVFSKNMMDVEHEAFDYTAKQLHGPAMLILNKSTGETNDNDTYLYKYQVDYRAFNECENDDEKELKLEISNGNSFGIVPDSRYTKYTLKLKIPCTTELDALGLNYALSVEDQTRSHSDDGGEVTLTPLQTEYRLYNDEYGSEGTTVVFNDIPIVVGGYGEYTVISSETIQEMGEETFAEFVEQFSSNGSGCRLYKVISYSWPYENTYAEMVLYNMTYDSSGINLIYATFTDHYTIRMTGESGHPVPTVSQSAAVEHKLEVLVEAKYTGGEG